MEEPKNQKPLLVRVIAAAVGVIVGFIVVQHFSNRPASIDQAIMATASQINKGLPMMVDKETRLENTVAGPDKTIIYRYTLINMNAADIAKDQIISAVRPTVVANYKTNDSMKTFRDNGVTMQYQYSDKNGAFIMEFSVGPKDL